MTNGEGRALIAACNESEREFGAWMDRVRPNLTPDAAKAKLMEFASSEVLAGIRAGYVTIGANHYGAAWFNVTW